MNTVLEKSKSFAVRTIKLYQYLSEKKKEYVISRQLLRSGTSIGANVTEAQCAVSKKDFLAKMHIAFKETAESKYWLNLLFETKYLTEQQYLSLYRDCDELYRILSAITRTAASQ